MLPLLHNPPSLTKTQGMAQASLDARLALAELRVRGLELELRLRRLTSARLSAEVRRVVEHLRRLGAAFSLRRVPADYYSHPLEWRRERLGAVSAGQLCKTLLLENRACEVDGLGPHSRFFAVVVQYVCKLDVERVVDALQRLRPEERLPRRRFRLQLAPAETSGRLTGFGHNAVSPFGMLTEVPVLLCSRVLSLRPAYLFLGAGEEHLKLGISVTALVQALDPIVADISVPRVGALEEDDEGS